MGTDNDGVKREILSEMRGFRIDPNRIKMTEPKPRARGGQASISIGTLIPHEEVATWLPEQLLKSVLELNLAIKKLEWDREDVEQSAKSFKVESSLLTTTYPSSCLSDYLSSISHSSTSSV